MSGAMITDSGRTSIANAARNAAGSASIAQRESGAYVPGRRARRDPVHERGAEPHPGPEPHAELTPPLESVGQAVDHRGEARPVVVYQLGGDDVHGRAIGQAHEP